MEQAILPLFPTPTQLSIESSTISSIYQIPGHDSVRLASVVEPIAEIVLPNGTVSVRFMAIYYDAAPGAWFVELDTAQQAPGALEPYKIDKIAERGQQNYIA